jgi:hypothetical protein
MKMIFEITVALALVEVFKTPLGRLRDKINYRLYRLGIALRKA